MSIIACILAKASLGKVTKAEAEKIQQQVESLQKNPNASGATISELEAAQKAYQDGMFTLGQKQLNITKSIEHQAALTTSFQTHIETGKSIDQSFDALFHGRTHTKYNYKEGITEKLTAPLEDVREGQLNKYAAKIDAPLHNLARSEINGTINRTLDKETFLDLWELERGGTNLKGSKDAQGMAKEISDIGVFGAKEYKRLGGTVNIDREMLTGFHISSTTLKNLAAEVPGFETKFVQHVMKLGLDLDHFNRVFQTNLKTSQEVERMLRDAYKTFLSGGKLDKAGAYIKPEMQSVAIANNLPRALRFTNAEAAYEFMTTYGMGNMGDLLTHYKQVRGTEDAARTVFGPSPRAVKQALLDHVKSVDPTRSDVIAHKFDRYAADLGLYHASSAIEDATVNYTIQKVKNGFYAALLGRMGLWQGLIDNWNLPLLFNSVKGLPVLENIQATYRVASRSEAATKQVRDDLMRQGYVISQIQDQLTNRLMTAADQGATGKGSAYASAAANNAVRKYTLGTRLVNSALQGSLEFLTRRLGPMTEAGDIMMHGEANANWLRSLGFNEDVLKFIRENAMSEANHEGHIFQNIDLRMLDSIETSEGRAASLAVTRVLNDHKRAINPQSPGFTRAAFSEMKQAGPLQRVGAEGVGALTSYMTGYVDNMVSVMRELPGQNEKMKYAAILLSSTLVSTYMMTSISSVLMGKDPPPLSEAMLAKMLARAMGPVGDMLVSGGSDMKGDVLGSLIPGLNFVADIGSNVVKSVKHAAHGEGSKALADLNRALSKGMPGQTAPGIGLLLKIYFTDQITHQLDPEAARKVRQHEKQMMTETGTQSWWRPGELAPDRAPDFSKMLSIHTDNNK